MDYDDDDEDGDVTGSSSEEEAELHDVDPHRTSKTSCSREEVCRCCEASQHLQTATGLFLRASPRGTGSRRRVCSLRCPAVNRSNAPPSFHSGPQRRKKSFGDGIEVRGGGG